MGYNDISENTREYNAKLAEVESDRTLSEEGKEERRKALRKEHSEWAEALWARADEEEAAELQHLQSKAYRTSYPSHVKTAADRERYDQTIRSTRMALRNHSGAELLEELQRALTEQDRTLSEAMVSALEVSLQGGHLRAAKGLDLWDVLKKEALNFRRKTNLRTAHDSYEHWRESDHDDLVLALCIALWAAERGVVEEPFVVPNFVK